LGTAIADFFRDVTENTRDVIGLQVVTMGRRASEAARECFADNCCQDYLYRQGYRSRWPRPRPNTSTSASAPNWASPPRKPATPEAMLAQGYRGSRYSFGYPACPDLADQRQLLGLLRAEEIGITLSEEDQLDPEQSTSAIVLHHPQAKYFSV
jgi:5-methyltetrahydrofolate--homocysteine methyltransferase